MKLRFTVLLVVIVLMLSACGLDNLKNDIVKPIQKISLGHKPNNQTTDNQQQTNPQGENSNTTDTNKQNQAQNQNNESSNLILEAKYFNEVQNVDGQQTIMNPENILVMVNKNVALPKNFRPNDLVRPNVTFSFGNQKLDKGLMRKEAAQALEKMFTGARSAGVNLVAASGFRSYQTQDYLFKREIEQVGLEKAKQAVAKPGTSEHQTGLTMDITSSSMNYGLDESFDKKVEGKWLKDNAYRFGFIMRYPKGKEGVTMYEYEPWHFRYVGVDIATKVYKNGWTLEEYFNKVKKV